MCNSKLTGAKCFNKGLLTLRPDIKDVKSARETLGHGTQTSSIAAGTSVEGVSYFGYANGTAKCIASQAKIAMYKVYWDVGGYASDIDAAIALFGAVQKGILVSYSAGNGGAIPGNLHNGIPWVVTTTAGSVDRWAIFIFDYPLHEVKVPGVVICSKDASKVIHYATMAQNPFASIMFGQTFTGLKPAPTVSVSSARGPSSSFPCILKPDIMAPGSLVLASWIPDLRAAQTGRSKFFTLEWSPTAIRSALVTTANPLDNTLNPIRNGDEDYQFASPLDMGAGQIDPNRALVPGLVYDANPQDYVSFMCFMNLTKKQILAITSSNNYTCSNDSFHDLKYPSLIAFYNDDVKLMKRTYERILTNVGKGFVT
ncbi:hypothetical protein FNV43_RR13239 [Rhamnella rubrinervis]|uniref:Peptidase S8/S53 domain-containing protein n=1 Tax=Rhamnella rubrinervis TaxID=2594499 RepID=A0A8K0H0U4_9ROSA|nr:hypothetical protein FNV43_RR13239 [Rhamnella rubrinervis]